MEEVKLILPFKTDVVKKDEVECSLVTMDDKTIFYARHLIAKRERSSLPSGGG